ncbi:cell wall metabolism sensor histidine kinase WalK [Pseudonocardia sp. N23]|uniref:sensor histidine kinase n=1 Tax=Pseudonocardia sp. N23 TaxID=1987376 RepID=UPI000BFC479C|nr:HAMP domain-containing sensor histidine kinase [Pseudonocardia sp. N23]GAY10941.1 periplasmic sensor signal transduction histidine kinase [Pseudonocardia sp. N23]
MNLRTRFALAFAVVAAVVAIAVGWLSYDASAQRIGQEIDTTLSSATAALADGRTDVLTAVPVTVGHGHRGEARPLVAQMLAPDGTTTHLGGEAVDLPVDATARAIADGTAAGGTVDVTEADVGHGTYRIMTTALSDGRGALQVAADVEQTHDLLHDMAIEIAWVSSIVLLVAAVAGWLLAHRITRRLMRLAGIAEDVSLHGGIDRQVPVEGSDEVARLSASFNTMLGRLAAARDAQERLIQDAAHELRTPLTSLRTNASVLRRFADLSPAAQDRLVGDVQGETRELSHLVDELVELALAGAMDSPEEPVALADVLTGAADRVGRRTGRTIVVDADRSVVRGRRQALDRAVGNLMENAVKFDGSGVEPIQATAREGRISVSDNGSGIDPEDAGRIFDRFYRARNARGLPGSGLGLSIVHDVAASHGGSVFATGRSGGGATVGFSVDPARLLPDSEPEHDGSSPPPTSLGDT